MRKLTFIIIEEQKSMINFTQFKATDTTKRQLEQNLENYDHGLKDAKVKILKKNYDRFKKSHECNQCDFASSQAGNLRTHLKIHSGEKSNRCNQCDYASSYASHLRTHLKTHSGENQTNSTNVTKPLLRQAI